MLNVKYKVTTFDLQNTNATRKRFNAFCVNHFDEQGTYVDQSIDLLSCEETRVCYAPVAMRHPKSIIASCVNITRMINLCEKFDESKNDFRG